jgi:hypothetical protein
MSKRLRVLLVTDWMPRPGGAEAYADSAKPEAAGYLKFLRTMTAKTIFEQHGFAFLVQPVS